MPKDSTASSLRAFPANGHSRLSANEPNPRTRAPFPRLQPRYGTAPKGMPMFMLPRGTPRAIVITKHPTTAGHIT